MPTASIVPAYKTALLAAWVAAVPTVPASQRWPGPSTKSEQMFLGESRSEQDIEALTAGRQWRHELAELEVIFWTWRSSKTPTDSATADTWVFAQYAALDSILALDPKLGGVTGTAGWSVVTAHETTSFPFETGWAVQLTATIRIDARLT